VGGRRPPPPRRYPTAVSIFRLHATPHVPVTSAWLLFPSNSMDGEPRPAPACTAAPARRGLPTSSTSVWWSGQHAPCDGRALRPLGLTGRPASLPPLLLPPASSRLVHLSPALPSFRAPPFVFPFGATPPTLPMAARDGRRSGDCQSGRPRPTVASASPSHSRESLQGGFSFPGPTLLAAPRLSRLAGDDAFRPSNIARPVVGPGRWKNGCSVETLARARWDNGWLHGSRTYPSRACKDG